MSHYDRCHGHYDRETYEATMGDAPAYGHRWLCLTLGPVSRIMLAETPRRIDAWLRRKDEAMDELRNPRATSHRDFPRACMQQSAAAGARSFQRRILKPSVVMAAGLALGIGVASLCGAGVLLAGLAGLAALPFTAAACGIGLTAAAGGLRLVLEIPRAALNIPTGYARRKEFRETQQRDEEGERRKEKEALAPLCRALYDDERAATKAAPQDRANWIYTLAKQFPEEFLEASRRQDPPEAPKPGVIRAGDLKGLEI